MEIQGRAPLPGNCIPKRHTGIQREELIVKVGDRAGRIDPGRREQSFTNAFPNNYGWATYMPDTVLTSQDTATSKINNTEKAYRARASRQEDRDVKRQLQYRVGNPTTVDVLQERRVGDTGPG